MNRKRRTADPVALFAALRPARLGTAASAGMGRRRDRDLARTLASPTGAAASPAGPTPVATAPPRRRAWRRAAVALAAVAAVAVLPRALPASRPARHGLRAAPGQFLLATAERAVQLPRRGGAFFYQVVRTSQISTLGTGGKAGRGPAYTVELSQTNTSLVGAPRWRSVTTYGRPRFLTPRTPSTGARPARPSCGSAGPPGARKHPPAPRSCPTLGRPPRTGMVGRQYFVDRDGYPVLTTDGKPVLADLELLDDDTIPVLDDQGREMIGPVEIPPGGKLIVGHDRP